VRHLAHELRQPLSTIESIAYYLEIVLPQSEGKARRQVEKLQQVVQQAGWVLSDAVHFLQASPVSPQVIDFGEFLSEALGDSGLLDHNSVRVSMADEPTLVQADPAQIWHLLRNLLFFFRQVSKPDPLVLIETCRREGSIEVSFEAKVPDCTEADIAAMFEPFTSHLPAGSGLALASVRRIVDAHGGTLTLESGEQGRLILKVSLRAAEPDPHGQPGGAKGLA
jgi:signal transduction histidine kinase